jgi:hypothetical protein
LGKTRYLTNWIRWADFYDRYFLEYPEAVCEIAYRSFQRGCWPKLVLVIKMGCDNWDVLVEERRLRYPDGRPLLRYAEYREAIKQQQMEFEGSLSSASQTVQEPGRRSEQSSAHHASPGQLTLFE